MIWNESFFVGFAKMKCHLTLVGFINFPLNKWRRTIKNFSLRDSRVTDFVFFFRTRYVRVRDEDLWVVSFSSRRTHELWLWPWTHSKRHFTNQITRFISIEYRNIFICATSSFLLQETRKFYIKFIFNVFTSYNANKPPTPANFFFSIKHEAWRIINVAAFY